MTSERIVDLEKDLHLRQGFGEAPPGLVDDDADCALRKPCNGGGEEEFVYAVEDIPAIAEFVFHETMLGNLLFRAFVPG